MKHFVTIALAIIFAGALMIAAVPAAHGATPNSQSGVPNQPWVLHIIVIDQATGKVITINTTIYPNEQSCGDAGNDFVTGSSLFTTSRIGVWCLPTVRYIID